MTLIIDQFEFNQQMFSFKKLATAQSRGCWPDCCDVLPINNAKLVKTGFTEGF